MRGFLSICIFFFVCTANAQTFSGQWTGSFDEKGRPDLKTDYVLEIEAKERSFEGSSITYFVIRGKRYFTICRIKGTIDPLSKTIVSTEVERIKANTPPDFKDCFQIHTLTYFKKDSIEQLVGVWKPATPTAGCGGTGSTLLQRKVFTQKKTNSSLQNNIAKKPVAKPQEKAPLNSSTSKPSNPVKEAEPVIKQQTPVVNAPKKDSASSVAVLPPVSDADKAMKKEIEKRENQRYETITLTSPDIEINLYDNAEVDGDIVTVLFNDVVVVSKQPLSKTPIVRKLRADTGKENLLVMYAENMGRIPPNTAFMRIKNGDQLYKVLLSADEKKNATVVFRITSL